LDRRLGGPQGRSGHGDEEKNTHLLLVDYYNYIFNIKERLGCVYIVSIRERLECVYIVLERGWNVST
jgi:hypothetical protein